jgi:hypothetical protein
MARFSRGLSPRTIQIPGRGLDLAYHPDLRAPIESPRAASIALRGPIAAE